MGAVEHAMRILNWQEHLSGDDMPPVWMWHIDHALEEHFEEVEERRSERFNPDGDEGPTLTKNALSPRRR